MDFQHIIRSIEAELKKPLPGLEVQLQMSSIKRIREMMFSDSSKISGVKSSVLILLYPDTTGNEIQTVLIQRPSYEGVHGGQISLPGGRSEESDKDLHETALREAKEEIGLDPQKVTIIGNLTELYIPPSNYLVLPYVGFSVERPGFHPDPQEVAGIIEIYLHDLKNDRNIIQKEISVRTGLSVYAPCFEINGSTVWGATAMMLNEFREILIRINY